MTTPSANPTRTPGDPASDQFPAGLRVLVVDNDPTYLRILEHMLHSCQYQVTKFDGAEYALNELRVNKNRFDIVICDVGIVGFTLVEQICLEMGLPLIMMSTDATKVLMTKGVVHGACAYFIKPVHVEALKSLCQHFVRKKRTNELTEVEQSLSSMDINGQSSKPEMMGIGSMNKKHRIVWSVELHGRFVDAVNQLGFDNAHPDKILELMNVPHLPRESVANHLLKYRLYIRRLNK